MTANDFRTAAANLANLSDSLTDWICGADLANDIDSAYAIRNLAEEVLALTNAIHAEYANGHGTANDGAMIRRTQTSAAGCIAWTTEALATTGRVAA